MILLQRIIILDESSFKDIKLQRECIMGLKHDNTRVPLDKDPTAANHFLFKFLNSRCTFFFINIHLLGSFRISRVIFVYVGIARIIVISILQILLLSLATKR